MIDRDGRWGPTGTEPWRASRWGIGDAWWALLVYVVGSIVLSVAVLVGAAAASGDDIADVDLGPYAIAFLVLGNVAAFLGIPWLATRRKGVRSLRSDFGLWLRPIDLAIGLGFGIGGLVGAGIVGTVLDSLLSADETTTNIPVDTLQGVGEIAVFFVAVALVTPVIEELFFRGLLYRSLLKRNMSTWASSVVATAVFVLPHLTAADGVAALVSLAGSIAVLGSAFQLACVATQGRLGAPIVAHVVVNGTAVLALAFT